MANRTMTRREALVGGLAAFSTSCGPDGLDADWEEAYQSDTLVSAPSVVGSWSPVMTWPVVAVHATLIPDGRIAIWSLKHMPHIWTPSTNQFAAVQAPSHL